MAKEQSPVGPYAKLDDWEGRLNECVRGRYGLGPAWGTNDCMAWVADCIVAQTGVDPLRRYRGRYRTAMGAMRALLRFDGVVQPIELMDKLWGPRVHISQARLGDPVVTTLGQPYEMGPTVGLCYGQRSLFVGTDEHADGLVRLDTLSLEHCYQPWASSSMQSPQS
jgi:hypothetical protein